MKKRMRGIFLFALLVIPPWSEAFGQIERNSWVLEESEANQTNTFHFEEKGERTEIYFQYDRLNGDLVGKKAFDSPRHLIMAPPGRTLWSPHPEFEKTLEEHFEQIFAQRPSFHNFDLFIQDIESQIRKTHERYLPKTNLSNWLELQRFIERFDFIEPIESDYASDDTRIDAFNLSPIIVFKENPKEFLAALKDFGSYESFFPLEWFIRRKDMYSDPIRLSCLALLTHNHLVEENIIRAIAFISDQAEAWQAALYINQAYAAEQKFWKERHSFNPKYLDLYPPSGIDFIDLQRGWEVDLHPIRRIRWPIENWSSWGQENIEKFPVPFRQTYHFYGAFIAAWKMQNDLKVHPTLIPKLAQSMGATYKALTNGFNIQQLELMQRIYRYGALAEIWTTNYLKNASTSQK